MASILARVLRRNQGRVDVLRLFGFEGGMKFSEVFEPRFRRHARELPNSFREAR